MEARYPLIPRICPALLAKQRLRAVMQWSRPDIEAFVPGRAIVPLLLLCLFCGCSSVAWLNEPRPVASSGQTPSQAVKSGSGVKRDEAAGPAGGTGEAPAVPSNSDHANPEETAAEARGGPAVDVQGPPANEPSSESLAIALQSPRSADRIEALERVPEGAADAGLETLVRGALKDADLGVRLAAVAALGRINTPISRQELRRLAEAEGEAFRAAAAKALIRAGDKEAVHRAASDRSPYVRLQAARLLAELQPSDAPDDEISAAAWRLLQDSGGDVQIEVIRSVSRWPWRQAAPLLLEGLGSQVYAVRKLAHERLSERWPPARDFPWQSGPAENAALLEALREEFARAHRPGGESDKARSDAIPFGPLPGTVSPEEQP